ncbi:MAG: HD domain-containing protein [Planctomycetes bacterium]|nr:HD domain-containing protein [Planctomycetota bacterium]
MMQELERCACERLAGWPSEWQGYHWPGYTLQHTYRVRDLALVMGSREGGDTFVLEAAGLLHDIAKPQGDDHAARGAQEAQNILADLGIDLIEQEAIASAVETHVGLAGDRDPIENRILADADYIDANFGLIAVWRYITIRGHRRDPLETQTPEMGAWLAKRRPTIDQLSTQGGRAIAAARYQRMVAFCDRLRDEHKAGKAGASMFLWQIFTDDARALERPDVRVSIERAQEACGAGCAEAVQTFVSGITAEVAGRL